MKEAHSKLVELARKWLCRKCPVVITEMAGGSEIADAIGWRSWSPILIECKSSRSDFLTDKKKFFRRNPKEGMGFKRYFMTPKGLVKPEELPEKWGLIEIHGKRYRTIKKASPFYEYNRSREVGMLLSALQRTGHICPDGVSIKCYKYETKNTATLSTEIINSLTPTKDTK